MTIDEARLAALLGHLDTKLNAERERIQAAIEGRVGAAAGRSDAAADAELYRLETAVRNALVAIELEPVDGEDLPSWLVGDGPTEPRQEPVPGWHAFCDEAGGRMLSGEELLFERLARLETACGGILRDHEIRQMIAQHGLPNGDC